MAKLIKLHFVGFVDDAPWNEEPYIDTVLYESLVVPIDKILGVKKYNQDLYLVPQVEEWEQESDLTEIVVDNYITEDEDELKLKDCSVVIFSCEYSEKLIQMLDYSSHHKQDNPNQFLVYESQDEIIKLCQ